MINENIISNTFKDSWVYDRIIKVVYGVEEDFGNNFIGNLYLTFKVTLLSTMEPFKLKIRYYEINDLTIRKASTFPLTNGLIIRDLKKEGLVSWQEYHVHDDSGYGENDGFQFIDFYCKAIEVVSVKKFYELD
nr:hypothetical protein [Paenibacillus xylanexedens]